MHLEANRRMYGVSIDGVLVSLFRDIGEANKEAKEKGGRLIFALIGIVDAEEIKQ